MYNQGLGVKTKVYGSVTFERLWDMAIFETNGYLLLM